MQSCFVLMSLCGTFCFFCSFFIKVGFVRFLLLILIRFVSTSVAFYNMFGVLVFICYAFMLVFLSVLL